MKTAIKVFSIIELVILGFALINMVDAYTVEDLAFTLAALMIFAPLPILALISIKK